MRIPKLEIRKGDVNNELNMLRGKANVHIWFRWNGVSRVPTSGFPPSRYLEWLDRYGVFKVQSKLGNP